MWRPSSVNTSSPAPVTPTRSTSSSGEATVLLTVRMWSWGVPSIPLSGKYRKHKTMNLTEIIFSLSNHSCCANTSRTNYGKLGVVHAIKTIFPNEKVYDNYGHFYHTDSRERRQEVLSSQYFFKCACTACKEDWDTYRDIARRPPQFCCPFCKHELGATLTKVVLRSISPPLTSHLPVF